MELFSSQDPRSYSLYFDFNIWFRARKVTGTFEKQAPAPVLKPTISRNAVGPPTELVLQKSGDI